MLHDKECAMWPWVRIWVEQRQQPNPYLNADSVEYSSYFLMQPFLVKMVQLAQFDKTSHAWQLRKLVIV